MLRVGACSYRRLVERGGALAERPDGDVLVRLGDVLPVVLRSRAVHEVHQVGGELRNALLRVELVRPAPAQCHTEFTVSGMAWRAGGRHAHSRWAAHPGMPYIRREAGVLISATPTASSTVIASAVASTDVGSNGPPLVPAKFSGVIADSLISDLQKMS